MEGVGGGGAFRWGLMGGVVFGGSGLPGLFCLVGISRPKKTEGCFWAC